MKQSVLDIPDVGYVIIEEESCALKLVLWYEHKSNPKKAVFYPHEKSFPYMEKLFCGVTLHEENLPGRNMKKKSLLIDFWLKMTQQITWNDVKVPKKCENNASW